VFNNSLAFEKLPGFVLAWVLIGVYAV
jgi:hypothetical protein